MSVAGDVVGCTLANPRPVRDLLERVTPGVHRAQFLVCDTQLSDPRSELLPDCDRTRPLRIEWVRRAVVLFWVVEKRIWLFADLRACPLWVKSRHVRRKKRCPLYPQ